MESRDWSSDVCSSDLLIGFCPDGTGQEVGVFPIISGSTMWGITQYTEGTYAEHPFLSEGIVKHGASITAWASFSKPAPLFSV